MCNPNGHANYHYVTPWTKLDKGYSLSLSLCNPITTFAGGLEPLLVLRTLTVFPHLPATNWLQGEEKTQAKLGEGIERAVVRESVSLCIAKLC